MVKHTWKTCIPTFKYTHRMSTRLCKQGIQTQHQHRIQINIQVFSVFIIV